MIIITKPHSMKRKASELVRRKERNAMSLSPLLVLLYFAITTIDSTCGFAIGNEQLLSHTRTSYKCTNSDRTGSSRSAQLLDYKDRRVQSISATSMSSTDIDSDQAAELQSTTTTDEQAVDEYLEFLDRRYRRLHEYRVPKPNESPFSVWKWLHQETDTSNSNPMVKQQEITDDVLYVLGVAGLASKKLLHKHHLLPTEVATDDTDSGSSSVVTNDVGKSNAIDVVVTETVVPTVSRLFASRKALIQYQTKQLKIALTMLLRGPIQMIRSLWKLSDGKRTVKRTLSITLAVSFIVFRTLSYIITSEAMTSGGTA